jgi:hypothetical protein
VKRFPRNNRNTHEKSCKIILSQIKKLEFAPNSTKSSAYSAMDNSLTFVRIVMGVFFPRTNFLVFAEHSSRIFYFFHQRLQYEVKNSTISAPSLAYMIKIPALAIAMKNSDKHFVIDILSKDYGKEHRA